MILNDGYYHNILASQKVNGGTNYEMWYMWRIHMENFQTHIDKADLAWFYEVKDLKPILKE